MDARTLSIKTIFGQDRRHQVPLFQRPYVWTKGEQWSPLWDDVRALAERLEGGETPRSHFLGAIVLDHVRKPTGHVETRLVIDGQQRLTTIQLLMEAFADYCAAKGLEKHHKTLVKLTRNDDPMSEDPDEQFKVWPTQLDQVCYREVMSAAGPEGVRSAYEINSDGSAAKPIVGAYLFFSEVITAWIENGVRESRVDALLTAIREHLRMVVIDLDRDDDPQLIFETLNARGTPLLPSDLVKNFVFHRAQLEKVEIQDLYDRYWRLFDVESEYWREPVGRGHARRARIDLFLQHYLTLQTRDEVPIGHLYNEFRAHASDGKAGTAQEILASLRRYADTYQSFDSMPVGTRRRLFFERLEAMDIGTAHPFLLELLSRHGQNLEAVNAILSDLESFLVRRMICQLNTRGYNRLFIDLLVALQDGEGTPHERVRTSLLASQADSLRWPDDAEFKACWIGLRAYAVLVRQRVRMILEAVERQMFSGKTEKIGYLEKLTIEHLLPQEWTAHWSLPNDGRPREEMIVERNALLDTFGNLTLLTKKLNPSVSNGPWDKKLPAILEHSALCLNRPLPTGWSEEAIRQRSLTMFEHARRIWPHPTTAGGHDAVAG
jgi:hypothetical protein